MTTPRPLRLIYVDHAATTPPRPCALAAMDHAARTLPGNPSSLHAPGRAAADALEAARATIAACLGAHPDEVVLTSGGTEADDLALRAVAAMGAAAGKRHILASPLEHPAVRRTLEALADEGFSVEYLPVTQAGGEVCSGYVRAEDVAASLRPDTALVAVMYASNELGSVQPIAEIGRVCRAAGVPLHTDAVQAVGHIPVDFSACPADTLALSAHKFGGPRGVGALLVRRGLPLCPRLRGGGQEKGRRAGTENLPGVAGMAAALQEAVETLPIEMARLKALRARLVDGLTATIPGAVCNGGNPHAAPTKALPGLLSLTVPGVDAEALVYRLDAVGVAASAGSACAAGSPDPSPALLALGYDPETAMGTLRLSLGQDNTDAEVEYLLSILPPLVADLRGDAIAADRYAPAPPENLSRR